MTTCRTVMCLTLAVLAMSAMANQTSGRRLLKNGKDKYSAALVPLGAGLPGSNAGGSGNCSVKWSQSKDKLRVKVYLFGQTQTTGISLNQARLSNVWPAEVTCLRGNVHPAADGLTELL
eukprot:jgi/Astpho2/7257/fgenesh1_pg.00113_%23_68_t